MNESRDYVFAGLFRSIIMTEEHYIIGKVKAKYEGEDIILDVWDDGSVKLPSGEVTHIDASLVNSLMEQYNRAKNPVNDGATTAVPNVGKRESKSIKTMETTEKASREVLKQVKIMNHNQRRNSILALVVVIVFLAVAACIVFVNYQQLRAFVTGEYNIAVVNTDIPKGDTIDDSEISFVTISVEEYQSLCGSHIVEEDGSVVQDKPIFFVDRTRDIVNKFATKDLKKGDYLMLSSVSAQKASEDVYVVETEDENGNRQQQTIDGAAFESDTKIEYFVRITPSTGEAYEIPLSSILLRDKTVEDILNEQGMSILTDSQTAAQP